MYEIIVYCSVHVDAQLSEVLLMFTQITLVSIPEELNREMEPGYKLIWFWLAVTIGGMILASLSQWVYNIRAANLMESPLLFKAMMLGGFIAFIVALINTLFVLPIWHDIRGRVSRKR